MSEQMTPTRFLTRFRLTIDGTSPTALRELSGACDALPDAQVLQAKRDARKGVSQVYMAWPGTVRELALALGEQTHHNPEVVEYGEPINADQLRAELAEAKVRRKQAFGGTAVFPSEGRRP